MGYNNTAMYYERKINMKSKRRLLLFIMFFLLPVTLNYFSPYVIIDGLAHKLLSAAFFVWLLMFLSSLFFGRAFCSYVCPYGGLQMTVDSVIKKPLKKMRWFKAVRYILGILWITPIMILTIINAGNMKINLLYLTESFVSADNIYKLIGYYAIVTVLMIPPLLLGKRATCQICPMSILNVSGTKLRNVLNLTSLRLTADTVRCTGCRQCDKACPMSLNVSEMVKEDKLDSLDCILCGECCSACGSGVLKREVCSRGQHANISMGKEL
jgi:polyferredoxin